jgi:arginase family enzyme
MSERTRVITLACRTSDRVMDGTRGSVELGTMFADHQGVDMDTIGPSSDPVIANWAEDLDACRGCLLETGSRVEDALNDGDAPVVLHAQCSVALTTLPTVARIRPEARFLWLDAHGDYNTPQTTPSGYLGGMPLAGACGAWDAGFEDTVDPARVVLCGVRDLDEDERELLERSPATVIGPSLETLVALQNALDGAPTYVHLDCDVLDPEFMPAEFPAPGGITEEKLYDLLDAVADACEVVGVEVTALSAPERAPRIAELIDPLLPKDTDGLH